MQKEFYYLIVKRFTNSLVAEEAEKLQNWIQSSPDNERIFNEISDIWLASAPDQQKEFDAFEALEKVKSRIKSTNQQDEETENNFSLRKLLKYAALILAFISTGILSYYIGKPRSASSGDMVKIEAPMGSRTRVTMADGTKVWLNGGSTLEFGNGFSKTDRNVTINGEGYFNVKHNAAMPFIVNTSEIRIKVLGTAFNIKAYADEGQVETTLEKGSLAIEKLTKDGRSIPQTVLEPNQRATFIKKEGKVHLSDIDKQASMAEFTNVAKSKTTPENVIPVKEKLLVSKEIDTQIFTSWKDDRLVFRNESFESLSLKLERWYGVDIRIDNENIKNYHFNGTFEKETIQDVLSIIHYALPINYTIDHNIINISLDKKTRRNK